MKTLFAQLLIRFAARIGFSRTVELRFWQDSSAYWQKSAADWEASVHRYEAMLTESQDLVQRGLKVIDTLRKTNRELADALNRVSAKSEFEMRVKRASGLITTRTNEAG